MSESLPKYMLLDENNEEIRDKRIMPDAIYQQVGERATISKKKKIFNTIPLGIKLGNASSIHNIEYSSKYGVMLLASDNEVVVKTTDELEADLLAQKQNPRGSMSISFSGELFLSPDQEILAICSESLMQFVKISSLGSPNNIEVPPIPNLNEANHYLWVDNTHFLSWKFQGTATLYTIDPKSLNLVGDQEQLQMEEVTGASVIHDHLFLISKMIIKIYSPIKGKAQLKAQIDMTDPNHDSPYFQYSYIIDIFKINLKEENFTENDVFGMIVVFYDVDEDASDQRFLTFAKGDIFNRQSLKIRGYENFYSTRTSKELFYNDDQKLSFSVKRVVSSGFICIMLEKSEKLYVVDPLEDFERLNVYDIKSKHQLKNQEGKFLQGIALMRNMLKIQRVMPEKGDELLGEIVKKYNGEFMSLYFKDKETSLTIPFPASILAVGGNKFYKRYAISSIGGIQDQNNQQIFERLAKMKRSPNILPPEQCKKIGDKTESKGEKKEVEKKQQKPTEEPKKEEKKQETTKPTGNAPSNLFKNTQAKTDSASKTGASLFGNPTADGQKTLFSGVPNLFGKTEDKASTNPAPPLTSASLFNKDKNLDFKPPTSDAPKPLFPGVPSLFERIDDTASTAPPLTAANLSNPQQKIEPNSTTAHQNPQPSLGGGSLFGTPANNKPASLFGTAQILQNNVASTQFSRVPFGNSSNSGSSIFGNSSVSPPILADLIQSSTSGGDFKDKIKVNVLGVAQTNEEKSLFPVGKSVVEEKPKDQPLKEQKAPETQVKKQERAASLFDAPAMSIFGGSANTISKPAVQATQAPAKKSKTPANEGFFTKPEGSTTALLVANAEETVNKKPAESVKKEPAPAPSVPKAATDDKKSAPSPLPTKKQEKETEKPQTKPQDIEQKNKMSYKLKQIQNRLNNHIDWQKKIFTKPSQDSNQTDYLSIKKECQIQQAALRGIKTNLFGEDVEKTMKTVSDSTKDTQSLIVSLVNHDESTEEDLQRRLTDYEEVSNKMLYYVNLLGRKKGNMRASMTQSQMIDKGLNNINRLIKENEEKIEEFDRGQSEILKNIVVLSEIKKSSKVKNEKKGKKYNFHINDDEELFERRIRKSYIFAEKEEKPKLDIKYTVVQLSEVSKQPKISLPEFERRAVNPPRRTDPLPSSNKQAPGFGQPQPQQPKPKTTAGPSSFFDKVPVKTEKVQVPIVPKVEPKKEEEKQAISQLCEQQSLQEDELQIPQAKRQISSIQQLDIRGLKPPGTENKPKKEEKSNKAPDSAPKAAQPSKGGLTVPSSQEGTMLFSQTTSIFEKSSGSIGNSLFANTMPKKTENKAGGGLIPQPAAKPKEQKKEEAPAPTGTSIFGPPTGSLFGNKNPLKVSTDSSTAQKAEQKSLAPTQPKVQQSKPAENKPETKPAEVKKEPQSKPAEEKKEAPSLNALFGNLAVKNDGEKKPANMFLPSPAKSNITSPAFTAFPNTNKDSQGNGGNIFGTGSSGQQPSMFPNNKKPEPETAPAPASTTQAQETKEQPKTAAQTPAQQPKQPETTQAVVPPQPETKPPAFTTDAQAQSNNNTQPSSISPSNSNPNLNNQQPQTTNANQNNPTNTANTAFMGTSFGSNSFNQPAPQFGGGNNRFMSSNPGQPATTGFNPNAAKFGGFTSNNQKSFGSIGNDAGNIFQGNPSNQQQTNPLATTSNMFNNQNNQNANTNNNNNGGTFNMFNNNANNNNLASNNNNGGNLFNQGNNPPSNAFGNNNNSNVFNTNNNTTAPTNVFGANTNNAFSNNNANNNAFNNNNNNSAFGANNNTASNVFGGNNTNNAFGGFGQNNSNSNPTNVFANNSNNNMFANNNNSNNNTSMFANTSNNNASFLSKLNPNNPPTPPTAVNPHLLQMRK